MIVAAVVAAVFLGLSASPALAVDEGVPAYDSGYGSQTDLQQQTKKKKYALNKVKKHSKKKYQKKNKAKSKKVAAPPLS
ncbi:MAG: hypothetical protein HQL62_00035 [Magnetococcales bacterium]|nr:hypothetical protein [Magnetococcales bacterium]